MKRKFSIIILVVAISITPFFLVKNSAQATTTTSEIVMEVNTNRVLHALNADCKRYMASTTKILTALVVIERCNMSDIVTVEEATTGIEGSSIYLEAGEKLTVLDLLYGLMLRSGNDCAETLAVHCSGNISNFCKLMNETALKIGATNSNFVNPHGLHDDNHYTTAYDLALISCYAMKNDIFRQIVSTKTIRIPFTTREYDRVLINKNKMLREFDGSNGIKTGYTKKAGRCLVSCCTRDGLELVSVVLNCPPMFERSKELLSKSFDEYENYKLIEADNIIGFTEYDRKSIALTIKKDVVLPLTKEEKNNIEIVYEYPESLKNKPKSDDEIGIVKIYCKKNLLFQEKIYTLI